MKISKFNFLKIIGKHIAKKLGNPLTTESQLITMAQSLNPIFQMYFGMMQAAGLIEDDRIDVPKFEEEVNKFFKLIPIVNLPAGTQTVTVDFNDVKPFIEELKKKADIEEVVVLPCLN